MLEAFAPLFRPLGLVVPVSEESLDLSVSLASGRVLAGQHRFTGKETEERSELAGDPIRRLYFCRPSSPELSLPARCTEEVRRLPGEADLVCFPVGSFFSSLLATVQLEGVGEAVAGASCPKLYMPNPGPDPETRGLTLLDQLEALNAALLDSAPGRETRDVLHYMLVDRAGGRYAGEFPGAWCRERGVRIIDCAFVRAASRSGLPELDPRRCAALLHVLSGGAMP
jgi:2-phospho-L-lactate transferase/gluconeogenesis factor (CofD/UPF0052 family)